MGEECAEEGEVVEKRGEGRWGVGVFCEDVGRFVLIP